MLPRLVLAGRTHRRGRGDRVRRDIWRKFASYKSNLVLDFYLKLIYKSLSENIRRDYKVFGA
jgi:hypothetical protein